MKGLTISTSIAILFLIFNFICPGITQEEDKGIMKAKQNLENIKDMQPDVPGKDKESLNWKNFKKPDSATLKDKLTPLQYEVTQNGGTEPPFQNEYNKNKEEGIYVDIVSGEPLFSSTDKYDSGTGWPSFTKPVEQSNITTCQDYRLVTRRTEVRSKRGDSHIGHVFTDGPSPGGGLRYCINSAALRFISKENLEKEGYGEYTILFDKK